MSYPFLDGLRLSDLHSASALHTGLCRSEPSRDRSAVRSIETLSASSIRRPSILTDEGGSCSWRALKGGESSRWQPSANRMREYLVVAFGIAAQDLRLSAEIGRRQAAL